MKNAPITEIMSRQVQSLSTNDTVLEAREIMQSHNIHHLPVMLDGNLVGIVSINDINQIEYLCDFIGSKLEETRIFKSLSVHEIMTKDVDFLESDAMISDAILIFNNASYHSLPVMENGRLAGIVSTKDVFRYLSLID